MQVHATGPLDHSDWVSIHRLSNKKAYTERVDIFLSEIVNEYKINEYKIPDKVCSLQKKKFF